MHLKLIDEIGVNDTLLTLEPSYRCHCRCTWCYAELNRKAKRQDVSKVPDTFASLVARSFGPDYDPTHFVQYLIRNRYPINWAAGVEPWQDLPAARAVLDIAERLDLSFTFQSRGLNWREVWPQVKGFAHNSYLAVSIGSDDPAVIKRFEPAAPPLAERLALIEAAVDAGMPVMVHVSPYHREWCQDLAGFARDLVRRGVSCIFVDPLHLTADQLAATSDPALAALKETAWSDAAVEELRAARQATIEEGVTWDCPVHRGWLEGVQTFGDLNWHRLPQSFPYTHYAILDELVAHEDPDSPEPLLIEWETARQIMENDAPINQPFRWSIIRPAFRVFIDTPPAWQSRLKPSSPLREYFRFLWNRPSQRGFLWSNPFIRSAVKPDGTPWLSDSGDLILSYDPHGDHNVRQVFESIDNCLVLVS